VVGDGLDPATALGPLISAAHKRRVQGCVAAAAAVRRVCAIAADHGCAAGHCVAPTIVTGVTPDMPIAREEIFGPVLAAQRFGDDEPALAAMVGATE
jgi:acyl-CoA reductase-like NAD-dependent aldehyde dehydrogenase